jgi:hypothetical protein
MRLRNQLYNRFKKIGYTKSLAQFLSREMVSSCIVNSKKTSPVLITTRISGKLNQEVRVWKQSENHSL